MFVSSKDTRDFDRNIKPLGSFKTFGDRFREAWESSRYEDLSDSRHRALVGKYDSYIAEIEEATGERLHNPYLESHKQTKRASDYMVEIDRRRAAGKGYSDLIEAAQKEKRVFEKRLESLRKEYPDLPIKSEDDFLKEIASEAKALREKLNKGEDIGYAGLGRFFGSTSALMTDPINIASLAIGGAPVNAAARTITEALKRAGQVAMREGVIGMGSEAMIQAPVGDFKEEINSPYTLQDALANIASAGVGAAGLTGLADLAGQGVGGLLRAYRKSREAGVINPDRELEAAETVLKEAVDHMESSPFGTTARGGEMHDAAMTKAFDDIAHDRPVDVEDIIRDELPSKKPDSEIREAVKSDSGEKLKQGFEPQSLFELPTKPSHKPRDAIQTIKELGGLKPSGETRAMDLHRLRRGLVRKDGKTLHEVRETMEEMGWLEEGSADNDVYDLIADALDGNAAGRHHPEDFDLALDWEAYHAQTGNAEGLTKAAEELHKAVADRGETLDPVEARAAARKMTEEGVDAEDALDDILEARAVQSVDGGLDFDMPALEPLIAEVGRVADTGWNRGGDRVSRRPEYAYLGKTTQATASKINGASAKDFDANGATFAVVEDRVVHTKNNHGTPATEEARGQIAVTQEDFELVPLVFYQPDNIKPARMIGRNASRAQEHVDFVKEIGGVEYWVTAELRDATKRRPKAVLFKTLIKKPAQNKSQSLNGAPMSANASPEPNVRSVPEVTGFKNSIGRSAPGDKKITSLMDGTPEADEALDKALSDALGHLGDDVEYLEVPIPGMINEETGGSVTKPLKELLEEADEFEENARLFSLCVKGDD